MTGPAARYDVAAGVPDDLKAKQVGDTLVVVLASSYDSQHRANAELYAQNLRLRESIRLALEKIDEASYAFRLKYPGLQQGLEGARLALSPKVVD